MINIVSLGRYQFIILPIALGLLLPTLVMPWVIINFQGVNGITPLDLLRGSYERTNNDNGSKESTTTVSQHAELLFLDLVSTYRVQGTYVFWIATYLASIIAMILSFVFHRFGTKMAIIAGSLAIASAITWLYSYEELKINFADQASLTGGLLGGEFKGNERALIDTILRIGFGPYIAISAGAAGILFYFIQCFFKKTNYLQTRDHSTGLS